MAEFLRRHDIVSHLHRIIKEAKDLIVLVSPYIDADEVTENLLDRQQRSTQINVVYGKEQLRPNQQTLFDKLNIKATFRRNLHAKCYMNENEAVVTSMNLYKYSQDNNDEMGILVSKEKDPDLYEEIRHEVMMYVGDDSAAMVQVAESGREYSAGKTTRKKKSRATSKAPTDGFCIRCKITLPANPTKPYCTHCYAIWKRYENAAYEEKHCHTCGKEHAATQIKPVCPTCYKKYQGVLKFAAS